jgi:omega-6 fatty acid desaturase (delta-12 desaturase)
MPAARRAELMRASAGGNLAELDLKAAVAGFQAPILSTGLWQIASSILPFVALCALMYASLAASYWLTLGLAVVAAGFVVRIFVIQHDCGHGSFFKSRRANEALGRLCSIITLTPYAHWRRQHAGHHAVWNDLDRRWSGSDIYSTCLTVAEYRALAPRDRLLYRLTRHPLIAMMVLPPLIFLFLYRVPFDTRKTWKRERRAVYETNLAIAAVIVGLGLMVGFERVLLVQVPVMVIASIAGVCIFSVQHRFEAALWQRQGRWNFEAAALRGSSYFRLPRLLQWFTANIGFHHIHHLNPRIPNYRLAACHAAIPALWRVQTLTIWSGLRALSFVLWDESRQRMVTFRTARLVPG